MKRFYSLFLLLLLIGSFSGIFAQDDIVRKELSVPKVDSGMISIDGNMDETEWQNAAKVDLVTSSGYEIFANKYFREDLAEPEFDSLYARLLWSKDTLYAFIVVDEFVNDSTDLFWITEEDGWWGGDQLFLSISNRLGMDMMGWYDGNVYAAPDGPYHFLILGDQVTLKGGYETFVPEEFRGTCLGDSVLSFNASDIAKFATNIDQATGKWQIEMAIYNPNVASQSSIGFNIGGSMGSAAANAAYGDAYGYYTWQPNIPNDPFGDPYGNGDPGFFNLANSDYWAVLNFVGDNEAIVREELNVPKVDSGMISIDGNMDETEWQNAAKVDLVTSSGYEIFANKYFREDLAEPEFDSLYARLLWSKDTLYAFIVVDEFVNDSTDLFWITEEDGWWGGDQLFLSISNRLGMDMMGWYDGNVYAAPDGPYHFLILGDQVTLKGGYETFVPEEFRGTCLGDSVLSFNASDIAKFATNIDQATGKWQIEMAIYNPNVASQSSIGFNIGGSMGSAAANAAYGDAYGYYTWQPNIPNDPFGDPYGNGDPGFFNLANSDYWAVLNFTSTITSVENNNNFDAKPATFQLKQNYPNPFNPTTNIRFEVSDNSPVTINIYNAVGQLVSTLVNNRSFLPGSYTVTWDASKIASGVYFYEMRTNNFRQTMKMLLLK